MTQRSITYLKGRWETGDIPTQTDYGDLMDSFVSLEASAEQSLNGKVNIPSVSASMVSAENIHVNGWTRNSYQPINPLGTAQASATAVSADTAFVTCTAAGERAVVISIHHQGRRQYIINDTASVTAITVYPAVGHNFIGTASNGGMLLSVGQTIQVIHVGASAYAFQRY
jgi:hypothetical protein